MPIIPTQPKIMDIPFCQSGGKRDIPVEKEAYGQASLALGFPPETAQPLSNSGQPPEYQDVNGILNLLSQFIYWQQSGGLFSWTSTLNYPKNSLIVGSDNEYYRAIDTSGPNYPSGPKDPTETTNRSYWIPLVDYTKSVHVGTFDVSPFAPNALPFGWYFMNGTRYDLSSPQGIILNSFSTSFKNTWNITITVVDTVNTINVPNIFAADGTGATFTPANQTALTTGQLQEDMGRNAAGTVGSVNSGYIYSTSGVFSQSANATQQYSDRAGPAAQGLIFTLHNGYPAANRGTRFKVYGVGMTPVIYLGV